MTPTISRVEESLRRCRSLEDPVALWSRSLPWIFLFNVFYAAILVGVQLVVPRSEFSPEILGFQGLVLVLASLGYALLIVNLQAITGYLALRPLMQLSKKKQVIFLRSFARDRKAEADETLRQLLRAALPPDYRLVGIRPPEKRSSGHIRFIAEGLIALRYLGSNYFELEADDRNWFARLLATAAGSHAIIIDIREMTRFVHHEMELAANFAGQDGCLFLIVDESQTLEQWRARFIEIIQWDESRKLEINFLVLPEALKKKKTPFTQSLVSQLDLIPGVAMGADVEAWKFARQKVADEDWSTPFRETAAFSFFAVTIPLSVALAFLVPNFSMTVNSWILGGFSLVSLGYLTAAYRRMFQTARLSKKIGRRAKPSSLGMSLALVPALIALSGNYWVTEILFEKKTRESQSRTTEQVLRQMNFALQQYWLEYGELPQPHGEYLSDTAQGALLEESLQSYAIDLFAYSAAQPEKGFVDPFSSPFLIRINEDGFLIKSAGADGTFDTADDLIEQE